MDPEERNLGPSRSAVLNEVREAYGELPQVVRFSVVGTFLKITEFLVAYKNTGSLSEASKISGTDFQVEQI